MRRPLRRASQALVGLALVLSATAGTAAATTPAVTAGARGVLARIGPFHTLVANVSEGPGSGDLALTFADGSVEVLVGGAPGLRLPPQGPGLPPARWVPDSQWILYARTLPASSGCGSAVAYYLAPATGGTSTPLPPCQEAAGVQVLPNAVVWNSEVMHVLDLPPVGGPLDVGSATIVGLGAASVQAPGAVVADDFVQHVAVRQPEGIRAIAISARFGPPGAVVGSFTIDPGGTRMWWSTDGLLALANADGVYLWNPLSPATQVWTLRSFPQVRHVQDLLWLPDGSAVEVLDLLRRTSSGDDYAIYLLGTDGSLRVMTEGHLGYVLGLSADGMTLWREEGVSPGVYAGHPGTGPFWLEEVRLDSPASPRALPLPTGSPAVVEEVSTGSADGDVAVQLEGVGSASGSCLVEYEARPPLTIPDCGWVSWIPGSSWIVYTKMPPTLGLDTQPLHFAAEDMTTGTKVWLPCPAAQIRSVDTYWGPNVAYDCGNTFSVVRLQPGYHGVPNVDTYRQLPSTPLMWGGIAVDPEGRYAAITLAPRAGVQIYRLPAQSRVPGAFVDGSPIAVSWSIEDTLAIGTGEWLGLWQPHGRVHIANTVRQTDVLAWSADGSHLLAASSGAPNPGAWRVSLSGQYVRVAPRSYTAVFGITADGQYEWQERCSGKACELVPVAAVTGQSATATAP